MKNSTMKWASIVLASLGAAAMSSAALAEHDQSRVNFPKNSSEGLPEFQDGVHSLGFDGAVQIDWVHFGVKNALKDGFSRDASDLAKGSVVRNLRKDQMVYPNGFSTGLNTRLFYMAMRGAVGNDFQFRVGLAFQPYHDTDLGSAGSGNGRFRVRLAPSFVNYSGFGHNIDVSVGQISPFSGLDGTTASIDTLFMERAQDSVAFDAAPGLGVQGHVHWNETVTANISAFTHSGDSNQPNRAIVGHADNSALNRAVQDTGQGIASGTKANDRWGALARVTYSPIHDNQMVGHFGMHYWKQGLLHTLRSSHNAEADLAYHNGIVASLEANGRANSNLIGTGAFTTKGFNQWGFEAAGAWGPYNIRGEFIHRRYDRCNIRSGLATQANGGPNSGSGADNANIAVDSRNLADAKFYGWHVEGSWVITGEKRRYDPKYGVFRNPTPESKCGAWEVAARYSQLNLKDNDAGFDGMNNASTLTNVWQLQEGSRRGFYVTPGSGGGRAPSSHLLHGTQRNFTVGVNWFAHHHVRVTAQYTNVQAKYADSQRSNEKANVWGMRAQFSW